MRISYVISNLTGQNTRKMRRSCLVAALPQCISMALGLYHVQTYHIEQCFKRSVQDGIFSGTFSENYTITSDLLRYNMVSCIHKH